MTKIIWSPLAEEDFTSILDWLYSEWNSDIAVAFINKTDILIQNIRIYPKHYPVISKALNIRKCVITKHNTLFYRVSGSSIEILRIFDTRQDPEKMEF